MYFGGGTSDLLFLGYKTQEKRFFAVPLSAPLFPSRLKPLLSLESRAAVAMVSYNRL